DYFHFDSRESIPIDFGPIPRFVPKILEENVNYRIQIKENGIMTKCMIEHTLGRMPQFLDFPVKDNGDWEKIKKRFIPHDIRRYSKNWGEELFEYYNTTSSIVYLHIPGFFGKARELMGLERCLISFYKNPRLIRDIMDFWCDFLIETTKEAVENIKIDYITLWEDIGCKNGPLISPKLFEEFMLPNYKRLTSYLRRSGVDTIFVDSDGNNDAIMPLFVDGGVNGIYPLEVAAGEDAIALRKRYRKLILIGNLDKRALIQGKKATRQELESKLPSLINEGGYIPHLDHAASPDIPFKNFRYYCELVKKYIST
ncbi:MAG: uroporphyrinogen decarboxylase family protein, partial [Candidatus Jordarchaeaceae archaeon]